MMIYGAAAVAAFVASLGLIAGLLPWLRRMAMAQMTSRSSHVVPTPQGAGLVVTGVTLLFVGLLVIQGRIPGSAELAVLAIGALALCVIGFVDDRGGLPIGIRFVGQGLAVAGLLMALPADTRVLPEAVPLILERAALGFAGLWFVNLFNFMDGIDWITFVEVTTIAGGIAILWRLDLAGTTAGGVATILLGATAGFAVWNRPRASVFLGDAGSLPIGLVLVWLMIDTAARGAWTAALLLPLYYWADATVTLVRRMLRSERFWQAHREHFYQQSTRHGRRSVPRTLIAIAVANAALVALGVGAELIGGMGARLAALGVGTAIVAGLLLHLRDATALRTP